ncbi:MAG: hypothetical protein ACREOM_03905 [Candidatus Dormibacteraceae bacterium]
MFFAIIEPADVMLDGRLELGLLTTPEFNHGAPLFLALAIAISSGDRAPTST